MKEKKQQPKNNVMEDPSGDFKHFLFFTPTWVNDANLTMGTIFQMGWFNHQLLVEEE